MIITELQPHDTTIAWSGQLFDTSTAMFVSDFERPDPEHDKPDVPSIDTPPSSSPTEWNSHELARLHREGHPDAAYLNAAYYGVIDGQTPDGSGPAELIAYKPSPPTLEKMAERHDRLMQIPFGYMGIIALTVQAQKNNREWAHGHTKNIQNPVARAAAYHALRVPAYLSTLALPAILVACGTGGVVPEQAPTLPPPGGEASMPPTPHFASEALATIDAPATATDAGTSFFAPDNLPRPEFLYGLPPGFGGEGTARQHTISEVQPALAREGLLPIGQEVANNDGTTTVLASSVFEDGNNATCVAVAPAELFAPDQLGGSSERLSEAKGVVSYGEPGPDGMVGTSDDVIATKVIATASLTGFPDSMTCVNAVVTDPQNPAGLGAIEMLLVDTSTSTIVEQMPAAFSGDTHVQVVSGDKGPTVLVDGENLAFTLRPGVSLETATPPPTFTPEPSATPDRVASFEIPADHAPWWAFLGNVAKKTVTLEGRDFALYRAVFQPYLLDSHLERINSDQVVVATAMYKINGEKKTVEVMFEPNITFYSNWMDHIPILGAQDEMIPIERLKQDADDWIAHNRQVVLYVVIGYGGIPKEVTGRNCTPVECGAVDDILLQMDPDALIEYYNSGGKAFPQDGKIRLLVTTVGLGPNDLQSKGEISPWPADQIRQFPFTPNP